MMLSHATKYCINSTDPGTQIKRNKEDQQSTLSNILLIIHVNKSNTLLCNRKLYSLENIIFVKATYKEYLPQHIFLDSQI